MDHTFFLRPSAPRAPTEDSLARHFAARSRYELDGAEAFYANDDTGVTFEVSFRVADSALGAISMRVPCGRPAGFALEAELEARALVDAFGLVFASADRGEGGHRYSRERFLAEWTQANCAAHAKLVEGAAPEAVAALPIATLERVWQWNMQRGSYQRRITGESSPCVVPRVLAVENPLPGRRVATAVIWSDFASVALPEVDVVVLFRRGPDGQVVRHLAWDEVASLLAGYERRVPQAGATLDGQNPDASFRHVMLAWEDAPKKLMDALGRCGKTGIPKSIKWDDVRCEEHVAEAFVRPILRAVAGGGAAPSDLRFTRLSTQGAGAVAITVTGSCDVEKAPVGADTAQLLGRATPVDLAGLATAVIETGFPAFPSESALEARAATSPIRVEVAARGYVLAAEASSADAASPGFARVSNALLAVQQRLEASPESLQKMSRRSSLVISPGRSEDGRRAAIEAAARGQGTVEIVARYRVSPSHEVAVALGAAVTCTVTDGERRGVLVLGTPTDEERRRALQLLLAAGAPEFGAPPDDGSWPRVALGFHAISREPVTLELPATSVARFAPLLAVLDAVYAASKRLGPFTPPLPDTPVPRVAPPLEGALGRDALDAVGRFLASHASRVNDLEIVYTDGSVTAGWLPGFFRLSADVRVPLALRAERAPPTSELDVEHVAGVRFTVDDGTESTFGAEPPRAARGAEALSALLELTGRGISNVAVLRALAEARNLWIIADPSGGGHRGAKTFDIRGVAVLPVFTADLAFQAYVAAYGRAGAPAGIRPVRGTDLFSDLGPSVGGIELDAGSVITREFRGPDLGVIRAFARAAAVERAVRHPSDGATPRIARDYAAYRVPVLRGADGSVQLVTVARGGGVPLVVVCTADDALEAFLAARAELRSAVELTTMTGDELWRRVAGHAVAGVTVNPYGPAGPIALAIEDCRRIAALEPRS